MADDINKKLDKLYMEIQNKRRKLSENERYVTGNNPAILDKESRKAPDNRIPTPLAKSAVEDMAGYAGRAGDITASYELVDVAKEQAVANDPFIEYIASMDAYNNVELENSELYEESLIQGDSYELWWTSDKKELPSGLLTAEYKIVPNGEILIKTTSDLKKELEKAIHFVEDEEKITADIYYPEYKETYTKKKGDSSWKSEGETRYPYKSVPVIVFKSNRRSLPYFEAEKSLIDAHDEVLSKSMNEIDRFNALITLFGKKVSEKLAKSLKKGDVSLLDDLGDEGTKWPEYLEKDLGGVKEFYTDLMDRLERLFHKSIKDPDMTSESFAGGNQSGLAIAFKLIGLEFKAAQIGTYFSQGLDRRLDLYADVYNASNNPDVDVDKYKTVITMKRNIPVDLKAKAEIVQILSGIMSKEGLLKFLPKDIVENAEAELERLKNELPESTVNFDEE